MTMEELKDRVAYWQQVVLDPLGLGHWRTEVSIVEEPHGQGGSSAAAVQQSNAYDTAEIQFAQWAIDQQEPDELDEIIVHELLHMAFRDLWDAIVEPEYMFGKPAWSAHYNRLDHEMEGVVDRLSRSIVEAHRLDWEDMVRSQDTDKESN
jgi:hypothetical protein